MLLMSVIYATFPALLLIAAGNDLLEFRIPNWISATLALTFPFAALAAGQPLPWIGMSIGIGVAFLIVGFILFAIGGFGGGDAKLLAAAAPWLGPEAALPFVIYVVFCGGAAAIVLLAFRKTPALPAYARVGWLLRLHQAPREMPYGVAIAAGALLAASQSRLFLAFAGI